MSYALNGLPVPFNIKHGLDPSLISMQTHITQCLPGATERVGKEKFFDDPTSKEAFMKDYNPYLDVKRIVFSKNEKFMVLITSR